MDPELKQALSDMELRIDKRFEPLETRIKAAEVRRAERIKATETNLLAAFHDWART